MDPVFLLIQSLRGAQQCYAQFRQMSVNVDAAALLRDRFKLLEDLLFRIADQGVVAERNVAAVTRISSILADGVSLASDACEASKSTSFLSRAASTARRFLTAGTIGEQMVELSAALDRALEDLQVGAREGVSFGGCGSTAVRITQMIGRVRTCARVRVIFAVLVHRTVFLVPRS